MRTLIRDEFTDLPVSRQRKHQLRRARDGKCLFCGEPAVMQYYCLRHMEQQRERARKQLGLRRRNKNALRYRIAQAQVHPPKSPADYLPAKLLFSMQLPDGSCHKLEFKGRELFYRSGCDGMLKGRAAAVPISPLSWQVFWMALDRSKVWDWPETCTGDIKDGFQWRVVLKFKRQKVSSKGKNAFPGAGRVTKSPTLFSLLLVALRQLTKLREISL